MLGNGKQKKQLPKPKLFRIWFLLLRMEGGDGKFVRIFSATAAAIDLIQEKDENKLIKLGKTILYGRLESRVYSRVWGWLWESFVCALSSFTYCVINWVRWCSLMFTKSQLKEDFEWKIFRFMSWQILTNSNVDAIFERAISVGGSDKAYPMSCFWNLTSLASAEDNCFELKTIFSLRFPSFSFD